jgi:hypothetical protein
MDMDNTLAHRLLCASRLAYAIPEMGDQFAGGEDVDADIDFVGFDRKKFHFSGAALQVDACYYGETTTQEAILAFRGTLSPTLILANPQEFLNRWRSSRTI